MKPFLWRNFISRVLNLLLDQTEMHTGAVLLFISAYLSNVEIVLSKFINDYDNIVMMGDFNWDMNKLEHNPILDFCEAYTLKNIANKPTCYKNAYNPTSRDVILTNRKEQFCDTALIETGLSDYHKMTVTCLKRYFRKLPPKNIFYRDYKKFDTNQFRNTLLNEVELTRHNEISYDNIKEIVISTLDNLAPIKRKLVRANDAPFMTNALRKSIMSRSRLRNKYTKKTIVQKLPRI